MIVDDLLATGGTMAAACQLIKDLDRNLSVKKCLLIIELDFLKGKEKIPDGANVVESLIHY